MTTHSITMREQMQRTISELFAQDVRLSLLLADISAALFADLLRAYPQRAINLGIMEQTLISVGAGMALEGFIPIMHSITPFLVERPLEQIKDDFCYQRLPGNFISTGASYEYSTEGTTHHGPADVQILRSLPGMQIVVPGTATEFDHLFRTSYANSAPTYYRMSLRENSLSQPVDFGQLAILKRGQQATVIAVGPMLAPTLEAVSDMDVNLLYCTTVAPFDSTTLRAVCQNSNVILIEPYYEGVLVPDICRSLQHMPIHIETIGVPHEIIDHYGSPEQHDTALGLTPQGIRRRITHFLAL